jgi:anti-anti-sigma regulatory factor
MLKITTLRENNRTILKLEGRLAGPWVQEVESCCVQGSDLSVDMSAVTYVDSEGKHLLKKLYQRGAKLIASGCMTNCLVHEIAHGEQTDQSAKKQIR